MLKISGTKIAPKYYHKNPLLFQIRYTQFCFNDYQQKMLNFSYNINLSMKPQSKPYSSNSNANNLKNINNIQPLDQYELTFIDTTSHDKPQISSQVQSCQKEWAESPSNRFANSQSSSVSEEYMDRVQSIRKIYTNIQEQPTFNKPREYEKEQVAQTLETSKQKNNSNKLEFKTELNSDEQSKKKAMTSRSLTKFSGVDIKKRSLSPARLTSYKLTSIFSQKKSETGPLVGKQFESDAKLIQKGKIIKTKFMLCKRVLAFIEANFSIDEIQKFKILPLDIESQNEVKFWLKFQINFSPYFFRIIAKEGDQAEITTKVFGMVVNNKLHNQEMVVQMPTQKLIHINDQVTFNSWIYGTIYKKSQILGKWAPRFLVIKHNGIYSYKNPHLAESHSFYIPQQSIKYVWTRFQILYQSYLIVKIKHGVQKTQLAIPIMDYRKMSEQNWLMYMCRLLG